VAIPIEAVKGSLTARSDTGYMKEPKVVEAFKRVSGDHMCVLLWVLNHWRWPYAV
jgi:hypothetical protein